MNEPFDRVAIHLDPRDDVAIVKTDLSAGTVTQSKSSGDLVVRQSIPSGHKIALHDLAKGEPVRRYGQIIGFTKQALIAGDYVHTHNLGVSDLSSLELGRDYAVGQDAVPVEVIPRDARRTFLGYKRRDGHVGTRNYIAVISSVNCSAHVARRIAHAFTPQRLEQFPNVDGVIALFHHSGCSFQINGPDHMMLERVLAGMARHPNVGAYLFVGLGCETTQISEIVSKYNLTDAFSDSEPPLALVIQDMGGVRKTIEAGVEAVEAMIPLVNAVQRTPQPLSELTIALHCGGSDSWSGVTANPMVGLVSDEIVKQGGAVLLGEVPEIYGAEEVLTRRAAAPEIGQQLLGLVRWWETHAAQIGAQIDNNPSPGNKAGGLTTIYEKSLGAVAKGGHTPLTGVYEYAEQVTASGLGIMNSPGNDWITVTGQVAGGCNLGIFTTGRGSVFGFKPAPIIKVCTNSVTFERMQEDMDINAGKILQGVPMAQVAQEVLDLVVAVASGQPSKSEALGLGEAEFCPWSLGGAL